MKLEFDSVEDLDHFLHWAADYRGHILTEPAAPGVSGSAGIDSLGARLEAAGSTFVAGDGSTADREAHDMQMGPYDPAFAPQSDTKAEDAPANGEKKRKRRTKAEIEADNAADAAADAERAAHAAQEAAEAAAKGANPFELPAAGGTEGAAAPAETAPAADAVTESDAEEVVTPFQHLTRAREFIAKHGMPKYNETFAKASLDPNVMAYTAYQRALHMTAMDELDKA